ncbi:MAG: hypothetical protein JKX93_18765 [Rhizobiaceae bacterium]|nr:hypothetical protein [Rhizobiaceae bacterium]
MPNYVFAYHGGKRPESPEAGAQHMKNWHAWIDNLGEANVDPGHYLGMSKTVSASGITNDGGSNPLAGFSIVKADTIEGAMELAKTCPHLSLEGTIEVAEVMEM